MIYLTYKSNDVIYNRADTLKAKLKHTPFSKEIHRIMVRY